MIYSSDAAAALGKLITKVHSRSSSAGSSRSTGAAAANLPDKGQQGHTSNPIDKLPVELLMKILFLAYPSLDLDCICEIRQERRLLDHGKVADQEPFLARESISVIPLVCRLWHEVIKTLKRLPLCASELMLDVYRMKIHSERLRKEKIREVGTLPLNVWVHSGYDAYDDLAQLNSWGVKRVVEKIASYTEYSLSSNPIFFHLYISIEKVSSPPFQNLRKLGLFGDGSTTSSDLMATTTIELPQLEVLVIGTLEVRSLPNFALPVATRLTLWNMSFYYGDACRIDRWMPNLQTIVLKGVDCPSAPHPGRNPTHKSLLFENVKSIAINERSDAIYIICLLDNVETVHFAMWSVLALLQLERYLPPFSSLTLSLNEALETFPQPLSDVLITHCLRRFRGLRSLTIEMPAPEHHQRGSDGHYQDSRRWTQSLSHFHQLANWINQIMSGLLSANAKGEYPCPHLEMLTLKNLPLDPDMLPKLVERIPNQPIKVYLRSCCDEYGMFLEDIGQID